MKYQLACGDVMPGCSQTFDESDKGVLLGAVAEHAAADHGIIEITPEVLAAVEGKIRVSE
jgi:predicted small metal-binding protein